MFELFVPNAAEFQQRPAAQIRFLRHAINTIPSAEKKGTMGIKLSDKALGSASWRGRSLPELRIGGGASKHGCWEEKR
ncbi:unnamed protein product, partial [Symbiodinium sp. KB8]